jgi:hypothetical protein
MLKRLIRLQWIRQFTKEGFVNCWTFFTAADPTHGYVEYVSQEEATELNLFKVQENGAVWMGTWAEGIRFGGGVRWKSISDTHEHGHV